MFQMEGRKWTQGNSWKSPRKSQQSLGQAGKGGFLQKVTVFCVPPPCLRPARAAMKGPYSSLPGTTQTATAVVEGGLGGPGDKEASFPVFSFS